MDEMDEIKLPIGPEEVAEAAAILQKYKAGIRGPAAADSIKCIIRRAFSPLF